jgi:hypothetical protein
VVGDNGTILKTTDAGDTWDPQSSGYSSYLTSVRFTGFNIGYATGCDLNTTAVILKTYNGGTNWTTNLTTTASGALGSLSFPATDTGFCSGFNGLILKTTNGGIPVGINEKQQANRLIIYPNPVKNIITIEQSESGTNMNGTLSVCGMIGQELIRQQVQGLKVELNVSSLPQGLYFIRFMNGNRTGFGKFIKE